METSILAPRFSLIVNDIILSTPQWHMELLIGLRQQVFTYISVLRILKIFRIFIFLSLKCERFLEDLESAMLHLTNCTQRCPPASSSDFKQQDSENPKSAGNG